MKYKIEFRISDTEKFLIREKSKKAGLTMSEFCRRSVLNKNVIERFTKNQEEIYKNLIIYHNNFARISNMIKNKESNVLREIKEIVFFFQEEIKNINHDR